MLKSMMNSATKLLLVALCVPAFVSGCASSSMVGRTISSDSYATGFHDGRHSGLKRAGNVSEVMIKDLTRFAEDKDYRDGWLSGEQEGIRIQKELRASKGVVSGGSKPRKEPENVAPNTKTVDPDQIPDMQPSKLKF
ncbi:hypothetical protein [Marinobacterium lacunae]|uniref:hypothetical protein n=1 Tax=Marinobacterium lacunae TaxID=1232683 RepID=UPI0012DF7B78|nr:hypothetical protein [Marinobacterium lacunae]